MTFKTPSTSPVSDMDKTPSRNAFQSPVWPAVAIGVTGASIFYLLALLCLRYNYAPLLTRYAFCHWVSEVSVFMFAVAVAHMLVKLGLAIQQNSAAQSAHRILQSMIIAAPKDAASASAEWLERVWKNQKSSVLRNWFGQRVGELLKRQIARKNCRLFEEDLRELADNDADVQHGSYGFVRIVSWAMPMFGFLGTVIGISEALGRMDTKALASGSSDAMKSLTDSLNVAFDTTAVGLVLTMFTIFVMFVVNGYESRLLRFIDHRIADGLQGLLAENESEPEDVYRVEATVRTVAEQFVVAVEGLVERQAELWKDSIDAAQERWVLQTSETAEIARTTIGEALDRSLDRHARHIEQAQSEGAAQLDARYHQWQTTLSDQARSIYSQQTELAKQTELLHRLVENGNQLRDIEDGLQQNLVRLTDIDRFHEAAVVLAEGVAVLGTQLERSGFLKPRMVRSSANETGDSSRRKAA
jgi:biopolymer transport protein ExbB/TolQ